MIQSQRQVQAYATNDDGPQIMVNSVTGKMGTAVSEAALRAGLTVVPYSLCAAGPAETQKSVTIGSTNIQLVGPGKARDDLMEQLKKQYPRLVIVDYTVPDVIHEMADLYVQHRTPFVMGTTGG
jgi:4-hydroxy-tetrahydrodipicolinate reductase